MLFVNSEGDGPDIFNKPFVFEIISFTKPTDVDTTGVPTANASRITVGPPRFLKEQLKHRPHYSKY